MAQAEQAVHAFTSAEETERLRTIFDKSFQNSTNKEAALMDENDSSTNGADNQSTGQADDDFDWSVTLSNVHLLSDAVKESDARVVAAELRAEKAEKRAAELEQWLRRLHQAVLNGLPQKT